MDIKRRAVLTVGATSFVAPLLASGAGAEEHHSKESGYAPSSKLQDAAAGVFFSSDGPELTATEYANALLRMASTDPGLVDEYGSGGAVAKLQDAFAELTGKKRAIYLPTGTMANQLATKLLSGSKPKVMVQDISHYHRDEAHAAQRLHGRRLVSVKPGAAQYTLEELEAAIGAARRGEVFPLEVGAISIECPVRRADGAMFDLDEIERISKFAKKNNIGMHLDGARVHWAALYSGKTVKDYARHFDTVYISLYKTVGTHGGAILAGPEEIISQVLGLVKIHGGMMFSNWTNAAVALDRLSGLETRLAQARAKFADLRKAVNAGTELNIESVPNGTNVYRLRLNGVDAEKFREFLAARNVEMSPAVDPGGFVPINANETLFRRPTDELVSLFKGAHAHASV
ncbi:MAG: aminotransferase class I/II-fold pyridoxal phosphate-dependent enzyme [Pseudomonadota bacterium]